MYPLLGELDLELFSFNKNIKLPFLMQGFLFIWGGARCDIEPWNKNTVKQRVCNEFSPSNDLAPPPPLSPLTHQQVVCLSFCRLIDGRGREGFGEDPRQRESLILYRSFNTLCSQESHTRIPLPSPLPAPVSIY
jgi:hypothetical protein